MRIERPSAADRDVSDDYVERHPAALLYHSGRYRRLLEQLLGCRDETLIAQDGGVVRGVLPLLATGDDGARVYNSLPYYGSNGGVLADDDDTAGALMAAYDELARDSGTLSATIVGNPFAERPGPVPAHTHVDRRIEQFTPLPLDRDCLEPSAVRNVRKAERSGVTVAVDHAELDRLRDLHQEGIRAIGGLPKDDTFFELVPQVFEAGRDWDVYVARVDGTVAAAVLLFYFAGTAEYFTPAVDVGFRSLQPLAAVLDRALADAAERGLTRWNWGGTWVTQTSLHRFKRKWGAEETEYRYHTQLNDRSLLEATPEELRDRFPHFFVVPFTALRPRSAAGV